MLREGVQLMLLGMGVVFSMLILMVFAVLGMSHLALAIEGPPASGETPPSSGSDADPDVIVAVTAAVHAYRKGRRR